MEYDDSHLPAVWGWVVALEMLDSEHGPFYDLSEALDELQEMGLSPDDQTMLASALDGLWPLTLARFDALRKRMEEARAAARP